MTRSGGGERPFEIQDLDLIFAHELHHLGVGQGFDELEGRLDLGEGERRAFELLKVLVAEGAATYLIDWGRNAERGWAQPRFSRLRPAADSLMTVMDSTLLTLLDPETREEVAGSKDYSLQLGNRPHALGAAFMEAIDSAWGLEIVLATIQDPRLLISAYLWSEQPQAPGPKLPFTWTLGKALHQMGEGTGMTGPGPGGA
jgi:hypothetical protein